MHFTPIQNIFHKNWQEMKKKKLLTTRSSNYSVSAKLVKTPYFGGVINPKTYLNYKLGSMFFS